jgi:hypothetical protein
MRFAAIGQLRNGIGSLGLEPVEAVTDRRHSDPTRDFAIGPASHSGRHLGSTCVGRCRKIVLEAAGEFREAWENRALLSARDIRVVCHEIHWYPLPQRDWGADQQQTLRPRDTIPPDADLTLQEFA